MHVPPAKSPKKKERAYPRKKSQKERKSLPPKNIVSNNTITKVYIVFYCSNHAHVYASLHYRLLL